MLDEVVIQLSEKDAQSDHITNVWMFFLNSQSRTMTWLENEPTSGCGSAGHDGSGHEGPMIRIAVPLA